MNIKIKEIVKQNSNIIEDNQHMWCEIIGEDGRSYQWSRKRNKRDPIVDEMFKPTLFRGRYGLTWYANKVEA